MREIAFVIAIIIFTILIGMSQKFCELTKIGLLIYIALKLNNLIEILTR